jgi:transposase
MLDEVYFKKTSRVQALAMIMTLCLFVYSMVENKIRKLLKEQNKEVYYPNKQRMKNPTLKWIFYYFMRAKTRKVERAGSIYTIVDNVNDFMLMILELLGEGYKNTIFRRFSVECQIQSIIKTFLKNIYFRF